MPKGNKDDDAWKPNLFVPGFPKCGTTALCDYLKQNPRIYFVEPKEPNTLAAGIRFPAWGGKHNEAKRPYYRYLDLDAYRAKFEAHRGAAYRAEGSQDYIWAPYFPGRLKDFAPGARLLFMVRDQKDRLVSLYFHTFRSHGRTNFREWVDECFSPDVEQYLFGGMLASYHREYGDAMRVIDSGSLLKSPQKVMGEVFSFLGVPPVAVKPLRSNVGGLRSLDEDERVQLSRYLKINRVLVEPARSLLNAVDPEGKMRVRRTFRKINPLGGSGNPLESPRSGAWGKGKGEGPGDIPSYLAEKLDGDYSSALRFSKGEGLLLG